ncbi:hypothetical protein GQ53DRAFT_670788 [Thozetella sp. PMI_491]|nr:hypothetical protein GQ53DRAFT_670788 [Thozetella sp. PMI_491]
MGRVRVSLQSPKRSFHTSRVRKNAAQQAAEGAQKEAEPASLSARMKKLSREYGWVAVGVYLSLSVLDFPFCFLLVRMVGTEKISEIEHWVLSHAEKAIPQSVKAFWNNYRQALKDAEKEQLGSNNISEDVEMVGWGVKEAEERNKTEASLATQLALAYAIHKSFIFIRVPLAAAVTPKVVKVLRGWGWQIGKKKAK